MSVTIQHRGDSAANWTATNPVLHQRELGVETDTGKSKMGDGATTWASLAYWQPFGRTFAGLLTPTAVKTANYTAAAGDFVPCDTTSGSFTVTLPSAPADLTVIGVKMVTQGGTNTVTITTGGSDVFNKTGGAVSLALALLNQGVLLQYKVSSGVWYVVADDRPATGTVVAPSGNGNGIADTAAIQAAINAANGPVRLLPAVYYLNAPITLVNGAQIIGVSDSGFGGTWSQMTELLLVNGSNCSMIVAPASANYWKLKNLLLSANGPAQTGPVQTGATGAAIHVADTGSPAECQGELEQVYVQGAYNDALYLGNGRRAVHAKWCKFVAAGAGQTGSTYGAGNAITCVYSDHVFDACEIGNAQHHGIYVVPGSGSTIRISDCDIFGNGHDWTQIAPTTVAAGSNGVLVSSLTSTGTLSVASVTGYPSAGSLMINVVSPVVVTYTGVNSGTNTFTGVTLSATQGNQGGTLATGQSVYLLGGDGVHIGSGCSSVSIFGTSLDTNNGSGLFVEGGVFAIHAVGNRFLSNSQVSSGLLPHVNLVSPNRQVSLIGNGQEPAASFAPLLCNFFIYANGFSGGWLDVGNSYYFQSLSTSAYTNNSSGIYPFSNGTWTAQGTNTGQVTTQTAQVSGQTAALAQWQDSTNHQLYALDAWARPVVTSTAATTPTVAVGAGAGTGATATIANGDAAGNLSITLGTGPASGTLATVTFAHSYAGGTTPAVTLTAQNSDAAHLNPYVYVTPTATGWVVSTISGVVFTGLTQPIWNFTVTGT